MNRSLLELNWKRYGGDAKEPRAFLDFVVDGNSLFRIFQSAGFDLISPIGWLVIHEERAAIGRLLLLEPADLPYNRRSLYVCHICGDLGCGAVSLTVDQSGGVVKWSSFGFENSISDDLGCLDLQKLSHVGPFFFDSSPYQSVLRQALEEVRRRK